MPLNRSILKPFCSYCFWYCERPLVCYPTVLFISQPGVYSTFYSSCNWGVTKTEQTNQGVCLLIEYKLFTCCLEAMAADPSSSASVSDAASTYRNRRPKSWDVVDRHRMVSRLGTIHVRICQKNTCSLV